MTISGSPVSAWCRSSSVGDVVEHLPPRRPRAAGRVGEIEHRLLAAAQLHALVARRQEAASPQPVVERLVGPPAREQDDERRQVLVLTPQAVGDPRAHARPAGELRAGLHERDRRVVVDRLGLHRADEADVVGDRRPCAASSSLSHAPLWPCWANLKIDGATGKLFCPEVIVVIRWPIRTESGSSIPRLVAQIAGLWSNRSICDGAPDWNR